MPIKIQIFKKKKTQWHDMHFVFNPRSRLFQGKLKSKWSGPFEVERIFDHEIVELWNKGKKFTFIVNGPSVKHYFGQEFDRVDETIDYKNEWRGFKSYCDVKPIFTPEATKDFVI